MTGCVQQLLTCISTITFPKGATYEQKQSLCDNMKSSENISCEINETNTGCQNKSCTAVNGAKSISSCQAVYSKCYWDGLTGCMDQMATCSGEVKFPNGATDDQKRSLCENMTAADGNKCELSSSKLGCQNRMCSTVTEATSYTTCQAWLSSCYWNGAKGCMNQIATCRTEVIFPNGATDDQKRSLCENMTATDGKKCQLAYSGTSCENRTCSRKTGPKSQACLDKYNSLYNGTSTCIDSATTCTSYIISNSLLNQQTTCNDLTTTSYLNCQQGTLSCIAKSCTNISYASSNKDCANWLSDCVYTGFGCVTKQASCASYTPTDKRTICTALTTTSSNNTCSYIDNTGTCIDKTCSNVYPTTVTKTTCEAWLTSCRYVGTTCQTAVACSSITAVGADDATKVIFRSGINDNSTVPLPCTFHSATSSTLCSSRTCANIPTTPTSDTDCKNYLSTCRLSNTATASCVDATAACSGYQGTEAQCKTFTGSSGTKPCWSTTATTAACIEKLCTHNTTATSDVECNEFLAECKTNGSGCVAGTTACSTFSGNSTTCVIRKAGDNTNYCKVGTSVSGSCQDKSCYDDASSTTDAQCQAFMSTCLTRGTGCIPNTEPCTTYRGTQTTCAAFTGSSGANKCWNTSTATATTACVNKKCSDDTTSTTDTACAASLTGCVTKGTGCIEKTAACSAYTGTQATCSAFKGNNGTVPCWNVTAATATTACVDKACTHNTTATTDADCDTFLPKASGSTIPKCVTDGSGCEAYPRTCSQFTGTTDQCGKFTASDGPCKSTVTTGSGPCTPRICTEALNTNNTDALCKAYHPSCVTTGYGCVASVSCSNVQEQNACTAKTGCSWVNNCRSIGSDCTAFTTNGASICVSTPVTTGLKKCAWYNNVCRAVTCEDLTDGLKTDDACKAQLSTCTTKGEGCITKGACSTYSTETICKAAKTTDAGDTCIWDGSICRTKKCTDAPTGTTTDDGCNTFLTGCKTNGKGCISSGFNCTSIIAETACLKDGSNKPCLWVNSVCYNYVKCEDITMTTHSACQAFSQQCTTNGTKCIAITSCTKISQQISCVTGTDGACGWLPAYRANFARCQKFGACSDAVSDEKVVCQIYGSTCITDGTKCIDKDHAPPTLLKQLVKLVELMGFVFSLHKLVDQESVLILLHPMLLKSLVILVAVPFRLRLNVQQTEVHAFPSQSVAATKLKKDVNSELMVFVFGILRLSYSINTKSCRLKVCYDFPLTTCSTALTRAEMGPGCVSNGINCIAKATCSTYTMKEACNAGGTDGVCVFTAGTTATPTIGTCKLMTQCSDANNDNAACSAKSTVCQWKSTTSGTITTTTCSAYGCTSKANGTDCNPVPSFDAKTYSICIQSKTGCLLGPGSSLTESTCYEDSQGTYYWNTQTNLCVACFTSQIDSRTNYGGINTGSTYGSLLNQMAIILILAIIIC